MMPISILLRLPSPKVLIDIGLCDALHRVTSELCRSNGGWAPAIVSSISSSILHTRDRQGTRGHLLTSTSGKSRESIIGHQTPIKGLPFRFVIQARFASRQDQTWLQGPLLHSGQNQPRKRKEFEKFTEILSKLLKKCCLPKTLWEYYTGSKPAGQTLAENVMRDVQATWKREEQNFVPDAQWKVSLALKAVVPGAVTAQVVNRAAEKALVQNVGLKVVGQGLGKALGGVGSFAGLVATDIALETIPGAKEAVGEGGRIGIGFAASAGAGAMIARPVGLAVGVVGYGIGEGFSQLFKLF